MRAVALVLLLGLPACGCEPTELPSCWNGADTACETVGEMCTDCGPLGCADTPACTCSPAKRWLCVNPNAHDMAIPHERLDQSVADFGSSNDGAASD